MPVLLLSHLPCSEHSVNIGSHFYQFGTYGKLDPGKPCIVSWLNMCYLHFWSRVCNQHEVQFCHSQRFLEVPSKTLAHSSTVPTLQDSVIILVDTLDPEHILSFHLTASSMEVQSSSLLIRGICVHPGSLRNHIFMKRGHQNSDKFLSWLNDQ